MTTTTSAARRTEQTAETLFRTQRELKDARDNAALFKRLVSAEGRVKELEAAEREATKAYEAASGKEAQIRKVERLSKFQGISVSDETPEAGVLRSSFQITYSRNTFDMYENVSKPQSFSIMGFEALPDDAFEYLIEKHPSAVPEKIMALAPDDVREAFSRYFRSMKRGFVAA